MPVAPPDLPVFPAGLIQGQPGLREKTIIQIHDMTCRAPGHISEETPDIRENPKRKPLPFF
jgi:hypothetical protein